MPPIRFLQELRSGLPVAGRLMLQGESVNHHTLSPLDHLQLLAGAKSSRPRAKLLISSTSVQRKTIETSLTLASNWYHSLQPVDPAELHLHPHRAGWADLIPTMTRSSRLHSELWIITCMKRRALMVRLMVAGLEILYNLQTRVKENLLSINFVKLRSNRSRKVQKSELATFGLMNWSSVIAFFRAKKYMNFSKWK